MNTYMNQTENRCGGHAPLEIERKFLIEYPDIAWLEAQPRCRRLEIQQTYLLGAPGEETRVRLCREKGTERYIRTVKRELTSARRLEIERVLTEDEYRALLQTADPSKRQICKTRYCIFYENRWIEIDLYPFWRDTAIAEVELTDEHSPITFPKQIRVIREVTDDKRYKNSSLASL